IYGSKRKVHCAGGIQLSTSAHPREIKNADIVFLPAIWRNPQQVLRSQRYLLPLLTQWAKDGVKLCAVGSSSCFLAEAGLLEQRAATTHWTQLEQFKKRYPGVQVQQDFLITRSNNIFCAASVNSVGDLLIYFIETLYSKDIALKVQANFSPEVRKSYASSLYIDGQHKSNRDEDIVRLTHWLRENFTQPISNEQMAGLLGISLRTLNRRFRQATTQTPFQYLQQLRVGYARDLLQHTNLGIADVAQQCGFCDSSHFCSLFKKHLGMTPGDFRAAVKAKLFA
ncbi:MAG: helix-turn-helix domain-containing protein, partial [Pseudomonadales bacterium]|nr:helix-turn-helix domain-containing protein [Pseudomonadales bacterium]